MTVRIARSRSHATLCHMSRNTPTPDQMTDNTHIAVRLRECADLLDHQGEDGFRVRAHRAAADRIDQLDRPLRDILAEGGAKALIALPDIGKGIAAAIAEMLATGHWAQLDRLQGQATPTRLFRTLPGVGPVLADRFETLLDVQTLEELETTLKDPSMWVPGMGQRRCAAILSALQARLDPIRQLRPRTGGPRPPVALLLEADALYRQRAAAGTLRQIAPRWFNPTGAAWLPVLHLRRADWHLTVFYSNTARTHDAGRVRDWVVIFFHDGTDAEAQCTIVTETCGPLKGQRVVPGREDDCRAYYASAGTPPAGRSRLSQTSPGSAAKLS